MLHGCARRPTSTRSPAAMREAFAPPSVQEPATPSFAKRRHSKLPRRREGRPESARLATPTAATTASRFAAYTVSGTWRSFDRALENGRTRLVIRRPWYASRGPWWTSAVGAIGSLLIALSVLVLSDHVTAGRLTIGVLAILLALVQFAATALRWRDHRAEM
jgi:hypothetical protein